MKTVRIKVDISTKDGVRFNVVAEDQQGGGVGEGISAEQVRSLLAVILEDNLQALQDYYGSEVKSCLRVQRIADH